MQSVLIPVQHCEGFEETPCTNKFSHGPRTVAKRADFVANSSSPKKKLTTCRALTNSSPDVFAVESHSRARPIASRRRPAQVRATADNLSACTNARTYVGPGSGPNTSVAQAVGNDNCGGRQQPGGYGTARGEQPAVQAKRPRASHLGNPLLIPNAADHDVSSMHARWRRMVLTVQSKNP